MNNLRGSSSAVRTDLIIVGAGIVGLAHAYEAHRKGYTVRVIERDARPNGASVRNFGHCCITAQDGELLETAYRSREGWLSAAKDVGFWAPPAGAYVVARSEAEMTVIEDLNGKRGSEAVSLMTAEAVKATLGGTPDPTIVGGAHLPADLRVDPRSAPGEIADWLQNQKGVDIEWTTNVLGIGDGTVATSRGDFHACKVLVCVGHDMDHLYPELATRYQVQRSALQMALAPAPSTYKLDAAVLTGTSMTRYDGFTAMPGAAAVKEEIYAQSPELIDMVANVMFARRPDGTVILGDSHVYGTTVAPFQDEWWTTRLVDEIAKIIGAPLKVTQRWQGVYASSPLTSLLVEDVDPKTRVITVTSGIGMTISFGIAAKTVEGL
ncbi:UNVERIFIED_ORG: FAD dependent oxidoreductase TIGR03364 [Arthrobacter sp. UYEF10]